MEFKPSSFLKEFSELATPVKPTPVKTPQILIQSEQVIHLLGLSFESGAHGLDPQVFSGNFAARDPASLTFATRYGGHQFGHWAGQLGDGRAIFLGELENSTGQSFEVQLKGAGPTPYSRRGDGRAVLRSSLREHLCSEAMAALGVPTTRSLCCVTTGESVMRDMFYDGNPAPEPGAIVTRVAPSFLRFGHFQILAADRDATTMLRLVDFVRNRYEGGLSKEEWFLSLAEKTARLMVEWQRVGFVHGVMNTDNLSVLGLTIDYGPYGWLDIYDPNFTPNTTDSEHRRYRFAQQPAIAFWNLHRLADALSILDPTETRWLRDGLDHYGKIYNEEILTMMSKKLGIENASRSSMLTIAEGLDRLLSESEFDMTQFFRQMAQVRARPEVSEAEWKPMIAAARYSAPSSTSPLSPEWEPWMQSVLAWMKQSSLSPLESSQRMNKVNPYFILRNFLVQQALDDLAQGESKTMNRLATALLTPYEENESTRDFYLKMPEWARQKAGCSALSCSS